MPDAESNAADYFAAELKAQRAQRGWTQVETGEKIGYSGSYVSDIERGDRLSTLTIARACDRVFGTPGTFVRWHEIAKRAAYPSFFAPVIPLNKRPYACTSGSSARCRACYKPRTTRGR
jgi:transcriptional regulator with XRE-family HTH domain